MGEFSVLLDAPATATGRLQVAKLGTFHHKKYGEFSITEQDVASWKASLARLPDHRALIDLDHSADRQPRRTEAAGWITDVDLVDGVPMADVEWTPIGRSAIEDKRYLFFSPTYGDTTDETGADITNALMGGALTNKPHLNMRRISLASADALVEAMEDELTLLDVALKEGNSLPDGSYPIRNVAQLHAAAILAASGHGDAAAAKKLIKRRASELGVSLSSLPGFGADSQPAKKMATVTDNTLKLLDLDDTADDAAVEAAVVTLLEKATAPPVTEPVKTLEQLAADEHKVLLDSTELAGLRSDATAGRAAANELHQQKFEIAWTRALEAGRAVAGQEESSRHFYTLDADATLKLLDEGPVIVNTKPSGWNNTTTVPVGSETKTLDSAIWQHIKDNKLPKTDYNRVLDEHLKGELELEL